MCATLGVDLRNSVIYDAALSSWGLKGGRLSVPFGQLLTHRLQCQHTIQEDRECHTSHIVERSSASHYAT